MPDTFLRLQRVDYLSDQRIPVTAWRAFAEAQFVTPSGALASFSCVVDSGAPFSVLPYSLWHDRNVQWTPLGSQLTRRGGLAPEALEWHGVPCDLGETTAFIIDLQTGVQVGPLLVVAKFVRQRHPRQELELTSLLGMNLLPDNLLRLVLDGTGSALAGYFSVP